MLKWAGTAHFNGKIHRRIEVDLGAKPYQLNRRTDPKSMVNAKHYSGPKGGEIPLL